LLHTRTQDGRMDGGWLAVVFASHHSFIRSPVCLFARLFVRLTYCVYHACDARNSRVEVIHAAMPLPFLAAADGWVGGWTMPAVKREGSGRFSRRRAGGRSCSRFSDHGSRDRQWETKREDPVMVTCPVPCGSLLGPLRGILAVQHRPVSP